LSFVTRDSGGNLELWPDEGSDISYAEGTLVGAARAEEVITFMVRNDAAHILGFISEAIVKRGRFDAIEVGFYNRVAFTTMAMGGNNRARTVRTPSTPLLADLVASGAQRKGDIRHQLVLHEESASVIEAAAVAG
jgi:hypothetical protein